MMIKDAIILNDGNERRIARRLGISVPEYKAMVAAHPGKKYCKDCKDWRPLAEMAPHVLLCKEHNLVRNRIKHRRRKELRDAGRR